MVTSPYHLVHVFSMGEIARFSITVHNMLACCVVPTIMRLWLENEEVFTFKTGLKHGELDFVWRVVRESLVAHYQMHHASREPPVSPFASLLATLYWLRQYPTTTCLSAELDIKYTTLAEDIDHTLLALFNTLVPTCFSDSSLPHREYRESSLAGVRLVIDSTFLTLPHNSDADERKTNYHHKSPTRQALKWQLAVSTDGDPFHISNVVHGSQADVILLRESGLLDRLTSHTLALGDKAYVGEEKVVTPRKKPRLAELKEEDKKENRMINSKRVVVENCFHEFKKWVILGGEYRGAFREDKDRRRVTHIVHVIGAMVKRQLAVHPLRAHPAATA